MSKLLIVEDTKEFENTLVSYAKHSGVVFRVIRSRDFDKKRRLAKNIYERKYGDGLCFEALMSGRIIAKGAFGVRRYLDTRKGLYPHLRYLAAEIDDQFKQFQPDFVTINNGFTPIAQIALAKALKYQVQPLFIEAPITPGASLIIDPCCPYFMPSVNWVDATWQGYMQNPFSADQQRQVDQLLQTWRDEKKTKIHIKSSQGEMDALRDFISGDARPVLLLGMQVVTDMSVVFNLPDTYEQDYTAWVKDVIYHLPSDWKLVIKRHPKCWFSPKITDARKQDVLVVDAVNVHDVINMTDATMVLCSNIGLESIMLGKPTILGGLPFYGRKGLSLEMHGRPMSDLPAVLQASLLWSFDHERRQRLLYYFLFEYQFWPDQSDKFKALLIDARPFAMDLKDSRRPFFEFYPLPRQRFIELLESYNQFRVQGESHRQSLKKVLAKSEFSSFKEKFGWEKVARTTYQRRLRKLKQSWHKRLRR